MCIRNKTCAAKAMYNRDMCNKYMHNKYIVGHE